MEIMDIKKLRYSSDFVRLIDGFYVCNDQLNKLGVLRKSFEEYLEEVELCTNCNELVWNPNEDNYLREGMCQKCWNKKHQIQAILQNEKL